MQRQYRVAVQHQVERLALSMLRARAADPNEMQSAFTSLADAAQRRGMAIRSPEAPCLSSDEILLLGYLAAWQRQNARTIMPTPKALRAALVRCAKALNAKAVDFLISRSSARCLPKKRERQL